MKKLLIILICGFAFTQSIQTRQFEVEFNQDTQQIDISDFIDLYEGYYNVEVIYIENLTYTLDDWMGAIKFTSNIENSGKVSLEIYEDAVYYAYQSPVISNIDSILNNESTLNSYSGNLIINITGLFEDELMPDVGDMNYDGNINVVDVVSLIDIILDN